MLHLVGLNFALCHCAFLKHNDEVKTAPNQCGKKIDAL
jgi:hypothetical protein